MVGRSPVVGEEEADPFQGMEAGVGEGHRLGGVVGEVGHHRLGGVEAEVGVEVHRLGEVGAEVGAEGLRRGGVAVEVGVEVRRRGGVAVEVAGAISCVPATGEGEVAAEE